MTIHVLQGRIMIGILALTDLAIGARAISGLATVVGVERMRMIYVMTRGMITAYMTHVPEVVQRLTNAGYWVRLGILWGIELAMTPEDECAGGVPTEDVCYMHIPESDECDGSIAGSDQGGCKEWSDSCFLFDKCDSDRSQDIAE